VQTLESLLGENARLCFRFSAKVAVYILSCNCSVNGLMWNLAPLGVGTMTRLEQSPEAFRQLRPSAQVLTFTAWDRNHSFLSFMLLQLWSNAILELRTFVFGHEDNVLCSSRKKKQTWGWSFCYSLVLKRHLVWKLLTNVKWSVSKRSWVFFQTINHANSFSCFAEVTEWIFFPRK